LVGLTNSLFAQDFGLNLDDFNVAPPEFSEAIPAPRDEAKPFDFTLEGTSEALDRAESSPAPTAEQLPAQTTGDSSEHGYPLPDDALVYNGGLGHGYDMPIDEVMERGAEVHSTNNWFRGGRWYSQQEFVLLLRTDLPPVHAAIDNTRENAASAIANGADSGNIFIDGSLSTKDADFTFEPGARLSIGRTLGRDVANRDHAIEVTFFGLFDYDGRATMSASVPGRVVQVGGNPANVIPVGVDSLLGTNEAFFDRANVFGFVGINRVPGFERAAEQTIDYQANLNSVELNYRIGGRPSRDRLVMQPDGRWARHATPSNVKAVFLGLRYLRQNEMFEYTSIGGLQEGERGLYQVTTDNDMMGLQLGGEITEKRTDWVIGLRGKLGGLLNVADRHSFVEGVGDVDRDFGPVESYSRSQTVSDEYLAFLGEAGIYFAYYLRPNTSVRVGYDAMYINGVATATNNLGLMPEFPKFEVTGDSLYHGMNFGFEMTW
jgi:hypothetical protein